MRSFSRTLIFAFVLFLLSPAAKAQNIKATDLMNCFNAKDYPLCLFPLLEDNGFVRIDKEYFETCERIVYFYSKNGRPSVFVNPTLCRKGYTNANYPVYAKNEIEIQFQKSGRAYFDAFSAELKKQCKPLAFPNEKIPGPKSKTTVRAYKHEATGNIIVIKNTAPVAYVYLLR